MAYFQGLKAKNSGSGFGIKILEVFKSETFNLASPSLDLNGPLMIRMRQSLFRAFSLRGFVDEVAFVEPVGWLNDLSKLWEIKVSPARAQDPLFLAGIILFKDGAVSPYVDGLMFDKMSTRTIVCGHFIEGRQDISEDAYLVFVLMRDWGFDSMDGVCPLYPRNGTGGYISLKIYQLFEGRAKTHSGGLIANCKVNGRTVMLVFANMLSVVTCNFVMINSVLRESGLRMVEVYASEVVIECNVFVCVGRIRGLGLADSGAANIELYYGFCGGCVLDTGGMLGSQPKWRNKNGGGDFIAASLMGEEILYDWGSAVIIIGRSLLREDGKLNGALWFGGGGNDKKSSDGAKDVDCSACAMLKETKAGCRMVEVVDTEGDGLDCRLLAQEHVITNDVEGSAHMTTTSQDCCYGMYTVCCGQIRFKYICALGAYVLNGNIISVVAAAYNDKLVVVVQWINMVGDVQMEMSNGPSWRFDMLRGKSAIFLKMYNGVGLWMFVCWNLSNVGCPVAQVIHVAVLLKNIYDPEELRYFHIGSEVNSRGLRGGAVRGSLTFIGFVSILKLVMKMNQGTAVQAGEGEGEVVRVRWTKSRN